MQCEHKLQTETETTEIAEQVANKERQKTKHTLGLCCCCCSAARVAAAWVKIAAAVARLIRLLLLFVLRRPRTRPRRRLIMWCVSKKSKGPL